MRLSWILVGLILVSPLHAGEKGWIDLFGNGLEAFKKPHGTWFTATEVGLDPANPRLLVGKAGKGDIWVNGDKGRTNDLFTLQKFGDCEVQMDFMMSKGSNSGIKFHGHYEVQICDSFGKKVLTGADCGGIYPRAEMKPKYHHIDKGIAPMVNACKAPGEWQTLQITFLAPRFDKEGKKTANARLTKVLLNGQVIHENLELKHPTGHFWVRPEMAEGLIMLQGDHGPVAFRNVKVRPLGKDQK